jgi:uncharacterized membrane protein YeaQ/YmgE (transglycosylase-associated protein family)
LLLERPACRKQQHHQRKVLAMGIIWTILVGFVVGLLAKMLTPGRDPAGFFITAIIGIAGSLLATFGGQALGLYVAGEPAGFIGSLVGAIILLVIYHMVRRSPPS